MSPRFKTTALGLSILAVMLIGAKPEAQPSDAAKNAKPFRPTDTRPASKTPPSHPSKSLTSEQRKTEDPAETARMHRMSDNLLKPQLQLTPEAALKQRALWAARFGKETNPLLRQEIITEMVQLDDGKTIDTMIGLFNAESHPDVRNQIILIWGFMQATTKDMSKVCAELMKAYDRGAAPERARILDIVSNLPTKESVSFMKTAFTSPKASAEDRFNAAGGLFKLAPRIEIGKDLHRNVTERLKRDAEIAATVRERGLAIWALAAPGQDNKAFFRKLLPAEKDPSLRKYLELASKEQPTQ
jgi:hypothetical protein